MASECFERCPIVLAAKENVDAAIAEGERPERDRFRVGLDNSFMARECDGPLEIETTIKEVAYHFQWLRGLVGQPTTYQIEQPNFVCGLTPWNVPSKGGLGSGGGGYG